MPTRTARDRKSLRDVVVGASIGTTLEWFDFGLYGILAALVFPHVFFPDSSSATGLMASLAIFGIGLAARPLGAVLFANFGDRVGRRPILVITLSLMGAASLGIAVLPGYESIGLAAPVLLMVLRMVQGFSLGGESSAAQVMVIEYAEPRNRGFMGSLVNVGSPLGQVMITLSVVCVRAVVGEAAFESWAWRVLFAAGALMAVAGFVIRRRVDETPVYKQAVEVGAKTRMPMLEVVRRQPREIMRLAVIGASGTAVNYVVYTYSVSYITKNLGMSSEVSFWLLFVLSAVGVALVPVGGWLADRIGRKPVVFLDLGVGLVGICVYFPLLDTMSWPLMLVGMLLTVGVHWLGFGAWGAFIAEPFPTATRYSGHAATYTLTNLVAGAPAPLIAAYALEATGTTWSLTFLLALVYVLGIVCAIRSRETLGVSFHPHDREKKQTEEVQELR
ncbi:MFS transporter [Saccharopolyspora sp. ASAGF58]|uniref:MFS transporter n=1 Tax=Saccharopolyspora sp. ASAGF58 TaxID=2719023 RepID=UPI00144751A9|nr:MFS transporter [Saccharopolyspora sp. ASAGF58]